MQSREVFKYLAGEEFKLRVSLQKKNTKKPIKKISTAQAMDSNGNLFFVLMNPIALACWDSSLPYTVENIKVVVQNDATLQFAGGVKVIKNLSGQEELWVITNRFQVRTYINHFKHEFHFICFVFAENCFGNFGHKRNQFSHTIAKHQ